MLKNMTPEQRMQFEELAKKKDESKVDELDW
jgi:Spy/CpxP family protein refolding chaperone